MIVARRESAPFARMILFESAGEFLKAWRMPSFFLPSLIFPIGFYALFGIVLPHNSGAATYLLATFGLLAAIGPALFGFGVGVATERQSGWLEMKRLSPLPVGAFLGAKLIMCLMFALVILAALYAMAAYLGGVRLTTAKWALLALAHLASAAPMGLLGLGLGLMLPPQGAGGVVNIVFILLSALGGLWMPITVLPEPMQMFAQALPTYHMAEICLSIVGASKGNLSVHFAALAGFTAIFAILAVHAWFRAIVK
jgi:ABC-2 type transport system permease protein